MGEVVLAAKITHVPSIWLSINPGRHHGIRRPAELGLAEIGRRARERGADAFVVADSHWMNSMGFHVNGKARHRGSYASHELPHFIRDLEYDYPGDPDLARLIGEEIASGGQKGMVHDVKDLGLEYATLVPMHFMNRDGDPLAVVPVGCNIHSSVEENRRVGEAIARAALRSDRKVAFLASGSLSHQFPPNEVSSRYLDRISDPFNEQADRLVLEQWREGRVPEFLEALPAYNERCVGEAAMADTAMLFGILGWDSYTGRGEQLCDYFPSSGTGQVIVDFPVVDSPVVDSRAAGLPAPDRPRA